MPNTFSKDEIKVLISQEELAKRIQELGAQITRDYSDQPDLVIVGVLKGSFMFVADLIREIKLSPQIEFIKLSSYEQGTESSGTIKAYDLTLPNLEAKNILVLEDIVDSGRTAKFLYQFFYNQCKAANVKIAALFDKPCRRNENLKELKPEYSCFEIDDKFIVGYGLDYDQKFRDLPYVGYFE